MVTVGPLLNTVPMTSPARRSNELDSPAACRFWPGGSAMSVSFKGGVSREII